MTNDEALAIIARMASAWPQVDLTEPTIEVWREHLITKRAGVAVEVVKGLEQTCKWFPTIAEFIGGYRAELDYERISRSNTRGLTEAAPVPASEERVKAVILDLREKLAEQAQKQRKPDHPSQAIRGQFDPLIPPLPYKEAYPNDPHPGDPDRV